MKRPTCDDDGLFLREAVDYLTLILMELDDHGDLNKLREPLVTLASSLLLLLRCRDMEIEVKELLPEIKERWIMVSERLEELVRKRPRAGESQRTMPPL